MLTARPELTRRKLLTAVELNAMEDGCRQQPGTATGVTFCTLEDETALVNLVVWRDTFERHSVLARTALLMGVTGRVQSEDGVVHLMAEKLWDPELSLRPEGTKTRSFY